MLILSRRPGESLTIVAGGKVIEVLVLKQGRNSMRLGFKAPDDVKIYRQEALQRTEGKHGTVGSGGRS